MDDDVIGDEVMQSFDRHIVDIFNPNRLDIDNFLPMDINSSLCLRQIKSFGQRCGDTAGDARAFHRLGVEMLAINPILYHQLAGR